MYLLAGMGKKPQNDQEQLSIVNIDTDELQSSSNNSMISDSEENNHDPKIKKQIVY
jgi:hypothetical protein